MQHRLALLRATLEPHGPLVHLDELAVAHPRSPTRTRAETAPGNAVLVKSGTAPPWEQSSGDVPN